MSKSARQPSLLELALRSTVFLIVFVLSVVIFCVPVICTIVLPVRKRYEFVNLWPQFNLWWLKVCCNIDHEVRGLENIVEPAIIFSKHQSTWETLALKTLFPHAVYVAKRELLWVPFFGWAFAVLEYININRSAGRKVMPQLIEQARDRLSKGFSITIFPEGTRTPVGADPAYKVGGAAIAVETGTHILPVAHNAGLYWPRHGFIKKPGTVIISIGPRIEPATMSAEQLRDKARVWIEDEVKKLVAEAARSKA